MTRSEEQSPEYEAQLMRKITWKLIPFLCLCFMAAFLDRVNVGFAKDQLLVDLKMSTTAYGTGAGLFFIGYFLFEVPSNLILERVGARVWIARIMIVWGIISGCFAFVQGTTSFYVLRFLLGAAEAGFFPGVIFYLTKWFPTAYRSRTVAIFMTAAVMSNIIGGPLSGLLLEMDGVLGLRGYKWMFLIESLPSVVLGVLVFLRLPNGPEDAKFLTSSELTWLTRRLDRDRAAAGASKHMSLKDGFTDWRVLLLCFVYFTHVVAGYGLDFFMPTLIKQSFPGASNTVVGSLTAIPAAFALLVMVYYGRSSDKRKERKWHYAIAVWWAAAGLLIASLPIPPIVGLLGLALAVSGRWSAVAPFWGLTTMFLSGTAAAGSIALINSIGNLGGYFGPQIMGWLKDVTGSYEMGLRILCGMIFLGGAAVMLIKVKPQADASPDSLSTSSSS
jgi:ACS family tartrate transporter-like MFS transporter